MKQFTLAVKIIGNINESIDLIICLTMLNKTIDISPRINIIINGATIINHIIKVIIE